MNGRLPEVAGLAVVLAAKDNNGAVVSGAYVSAKNHGRITFLVVCGVITNAVTLTVSQAKDAAGTGVKAVTLVAGDVYARGSYMPVQTDSLITAGNLVIPASGDNKLYVVDVPAERLDRANGFCYLTITGADPGASAFFSAVAVGTAQLASSAATGLPDMTA